jgi:superoxide dismutase, Cu-Zn family
MGTRSRMAGAAAACAALVLLSGCNAKDYQVAKIAPTQGNTAKGEVRFYKVDGGVRVIASIEGLTPGKHGVHEKGDCSAPDAMSAGGHFNPTGSPHGAPTAPPTARHAGDLGNLEVGPEGKANYDRVDSMLAYDSITGLSVLIHAGEDDFVTQPSGNSGARVGCGVIERVR